MSSAVVFDSKTGNTKLLAQWTAEELEDCAFCGGTEDCDRDKYQNYFVGFWTDKGSCTEKVRDFLQSLHGKNVYLFGTAGFGVSQEYFDKIMEGVKSFVPLDNRTEALFMCQGKMPASVRERYVKMLDDPEKSAQAAMLIKNFDMASSHPNADDRENLLSRIREIKLP